MKFPCFNFGKSRGILPAFGQLTGTVVIEPNPRDQTFVIAGNEIVVTGVKQ